MQFRTPLQWNIIFFSSKRGRYSARPQLYRPRFGTEKLVLIKIYSVFFSFYLVFILEIILRSFFLFFFVLIHLLSNRYVIFILKVFNSEFLINYISIPSSLLQFQHLSIPTTVIAKNAAISVLTATLPPLCPSLGN